MLSPGDLLDDRYRLDEPIATGGMGDVWRATDTVLGRRVAVKVLRSGRAADPEFQQRFRHEARTMAALRHPGLAEVYDFGESGDRAYLVMTHVDGQALEDRIAEAGRLGTAETMAIVAQAGRALEAAHAAGIIHRDVKPGNLIVKPDGTVVLVDFGVARSGESVVLTGVDEVVGTALYIAPEQVSKREVGPAADVYALGVVAYQCLAGRPPFLGGDPVSIALRHVEDDPPPLPDDVPTAVRSLVATALAKDPADRFPSAAAMADAAEAVAADTATGGTGVVPPIPPPPTAAGTPTAAGASTRRRGRAMVWAAVLVVLTALGVMLALAGPLGLSPGPGPAPVSPQVPDGSAGAPPVGGASPGGPGSPGAAPGPGSAPPGRASVPAGGNPGGTGQPPPRTSPPPPNPTTNPDPTGSTR